MDPRLKERLVGAVVLVALAVILVPGILDGPEPVPATSTAPLSLPAPEQAAPRRTQTIELGRRDEPAGTAVDTGRSAASPETAASVAPETPAAPVISRESSARDDDDAPAAAPQPLQAGWVVQLGSFSEQENAKRLVERVSSHGHSATISTHPGGGRVMYRVRTAPEATRERAEAVASSLTAHGFVAQVMAGD